MMRHMSCGDLTRREWLTRAAALAGGACAQLSGTAQTTVRPNDTVRGRVAPELPGVTLMHEHVLVDFIGADKVSPDRYDRAEVVRVVLPHLQQLRGLGCETLVECTPAYLGRDPRLITELSGRSGLRILTNTGYYGAANDKHLPPHAFTETAEQLAARWIRESERGIDGTNVRPSFMKIGVDGAPLSDVDRKLVRAAALTHRATGLAIASHTGSGAAALEELAILEDARAPLSAFIWVHAQSERDTTFHTRAAARGAWVEFDGVSPKSVEQHVALVRNMKANGFFGRVLVSHDAGWYRVGEPGGGAFRPFDTIFTAFLPALEAAGLSRAETQQLMVDHPRRALAGAMQP